MGTTPPLTSAYAQGGFSMQFLNLTGTVACLADASGFNWIEDPSKTTTWGVHHLGELTLRARSPAGSGTWAGVSTAETTGLPGASSAPMVPPIYPGGFAAWDLTPMVGPLAGMGVVASREYGAPEDGSEGLVVTFVLGNKGNATVEFGSVELSAVHNNDWSGLTLEQNAEQCSLSDPHVGAGAGYVQFTRITGTGPALLLAPYTGGCTGSAPASLPSRCGARVEAYRMVREDAGARSGTFEGRYALLSHSLAYA